MELEGEQLDRFARSLSRAMVASKYIPGTSNRCSSTPAHRYFITNSITREVEFRWFMAKKKRMLKLRLDGHDYEELN